MKRFHVHAHVDDLKASVAFYSKLFAAEPTRLEGDYAKWMIEDPRINFAISTREGEGAGRRHGAARRRRDDLLLCPKREALGHRPAGDRLGALPYARQHPDIQPGQRRRAPASGCVLRQCGAERQAGRSPR